MKIVITSPSNKVHTATCKHPNKSAPGSVRTAHGKRADAIIEKALDDTDSEYVPCKPCAKGLAPALAKA